jgi:hypothetical protein
MAGPFIVITPVGFAQGRQALAQFSDVLADELLTAMTEVDLFLQREVMEATPTAYGTLRASIFAEERINGDGILGVVASPLNYVEYVELGTRPHFPPVAPLEDWVRKKLGLTDDAQVAGVALAIARKIAARGTLAVGMFNRTFRYYQPQVEKRFEAALQRAVQRTQSGAG